MEDPLEVFATYLLAQPGPHRVLVERLDQGAIGAAPRGRREFASRLYLLAVSKQRVIAVMMTTCGVDRGSALLK